MAAMVIVKLGGGEPTREDYERVKRIRKLVQASRPPTPWTWYVGWALTAAVQIAAVVAVAGLLAVLWWTPLTGDVPWTR